MHSNKFLVTASALALLAATATAGLSQTPSPNEAAQEQQKTNPSDGNRGQNDAPATKAPDKSERNRPSAQRNGETAPKASERAHDKASPKSRVQGQETTPKASKRAQEKASPNSAVKERSQADDARDKRSTEEKTRDAPRQSNKGLSKDTDRSAEERARRDKRDDRDRGNRAERERTKDRDTGDAATRSERDDRDRSGRAEGDNGSRDRAQLSEQKRSSIRERIAKSGRSDRVTNVNFDVRVGATVPRRTTLHVLPPDVVEVVPEYRDYRYVYVRDEIVIINPRTYAVVAVIDDGERRGSRSDTRINLSTDDQAYIRQTVDRGASVRLGTDNVFVGMDLPDTVELRPLPEVVVERHPDLRDYRYFVYEGDVVLVEPQSREVALVIED